MVKFIAKKLPYKKLNSNRNHNIKANAKEIKCYLSDNKIENSLEKYKLPIPNDVLKRNIKLQDVKSCSKFQGTNFTNRPTMPYLKPMDSNNKGKRNFYRAARKGFLSTGRKIHNTNLGSNLINTNSSKSLNKNKVVRKA